MRHRRIAHVDARAVGFDEGTGPDAPGVLALTAHRTTHLALSDPSGAGIRWTGDPEDGEPWEEPILRGGPVTDVNVLDLVRRRDVWASAVVAVAYPRMRTAGAGCEPDHTPLMLEVSDLPATVAVWQPDRPVPVWLSLWPRQVWVFDDLGDAASTDGAPAPGSWEPPSAYFLPADVDDDEAADRELLTRVAGQVESLTVHVNACSGTQFGIAVLVVGAGRPSVAVPLTSDDLAGTGLKVGRVIAVEGVLRAAYAGPPISTILEPMTLHWAAWKLDLGWVGPEARSVVAVPPGHTWTTSAPPGALVLDDVVAAAAAAPGVGVCVLDDGDGEITLAGVGVKEDEETWLCDLELPVTKFAVRAAAALVTTAERVCVVDSATGEFLLWATDPPMGEVQWVVSTVALWALVGTDADDAGPWTLLRLSRDRWSTDRPSFAALADRWELPAATGRGDGYQRPSVRPGDTSCFSAVAIVPDGTGPGTVVRVGAAGEPQMLRPAADLLPIQAMDTPAGELVARRQGMWFAGRPLQPLALPLGKYTSWAPIGPDVVGGEIVPAYEHADEMGPTRLGVLTLTPGAPRWHEVERSHQLHDVRWVRDALDENLVWWSSCTPTGTRVGRVDLRTGRVSAHSFDGVVANLLCADATGRRCVLRVHPPTDRVQDPEGLPARRGAHEPGRVWPLPNPVRTSTVRFLELDLR